MKAIISLTARSACLCRREFLDVSARGSGALLALTGLALLAAHPWALPS